jgi:hypothetical protein
MPLQTHRSLRAAFQKVYAAVRRTSPASVAASGAQLPSAMALSCTHRKRASCKRASYIYRIRAVAGI